MGWARAGQLTCNMRTYVFRSLTLTGPIFKVIFILSYLETKNEILYIGGKSRIKQKNRVKRKTEQLAQAGKLRSVQIHKHTNK